MSTKLEDLIVAAKSDSTRQAEVYNEFLATELILPGKEGGPSETTGKGKLDLVVLHTGGGQAVAVFTSMERFQEAKGKNPVFGKIGAFRLKGREVMKLASAAAADMGVVLNPDTSTGLAFPADVVRGQIEGRKSDWPRMIEIKAGEAAYLGHPAKYPTALVDALRGLFQASGVVERAYLAQVYLPARKEPPHVVIGITRVQDAAKTFAEFLPEMGHVAQQMLGPGELVDFFEVRRDTISDFVLKQTKPFYAKH